MEQPAPAETPAMDEAAFAAACERLRPGLYAYAVTCSRDSHLAEDIVQETLLIAHRKRLLYTPEADFGLWLVSIARNVWFRERERTARQRRRVAPQPIQDLAIELVHVEDGTWESETEALRQCLATLRSEDRALLDRHFTTGEEYETIAAALARTLSWVKVRMFRLRKALLTCVQRRLGGSAHA